MASKGGSAKRLQIPAETVPGPRIFLYAFILAALALLLAILRLSERQIDNPPRDRAAIARVAEACGHAPDDLCLVVLGDSRMWFGLDAGQVSRVLSADLGQKVDFAGVYIPNGELDAFDAPLRELATVGIDVMFVQRSLPNKDIGMGGRVKENLRILIQRVLLASATFQARVAASLDSGDPCSKLLRDRKGVKDNLVAADDGRFSAMAAELRKAGVRVALIAGPPTKSGPLTYPPVQGADTLVPKVAIPKTMYCDQIHVGASGRELYSHAFADSVAAWLKN